MDFELSAIGYAVLLFVCMVACAEVGRRFAHRRASHDPDGAWQGIGVVDGAVFGLLGLIIAFTFSGAASRFETRRNLIVEEANSIGTTYLRLDLLPSAVQPAMRENFRKYVDSRIRVYKQFPDFVAVAAELNANKTLQDEIWNQAVAGVQGSQPATMLLLPALNQMFDVASTRMLTTHFHPPTAIFAMMFGLALIGATTAGYGMAKAKSRAWFHLLGLASVTSIAFYVILDLEYPRLGYIQIEVFDQAMRDLRGSMK